jgi:cysteine synthase A
VPEVLDLSLVDAIEQVSNEEAVDYARRLAREEGILAASPAAPPPRPRCAGRTSPRTPARPSWSMLPDSGERYLSSVLFEGLFDGPCPFG